MDGKIAVLGVVIAGVLATIVEEGKYTLGDTVIGITLLLTLVAFNDPRLSVGADGKGLSEKPLHTASYAAGWGLCAWLIPGPLLRASANRLATFLTWQPSERFDSLPIVP